MVKPLVVKYLEVHMERLHKTNKTRLNKATNRLPYSNGTFSSLIIEWGIPKKAVHLPGAQTDVLEAFPKGFFVKTGHPSVTISSI